MSLKTKHKELKREVLIAEDKRNERRGYNSWLKLRELKKLKLKAKDKLNEIKQKF
jgi:uncharacterized protein YdcH (DUF465 family)